MENKKTNAPANAVQSILQEQTNANLNSGQQDDYNKPATINQELRTHLKKVNEITDCIADINISAEYANFMINTLLNEADEITDNASILINFKSIVLFV